MPGLHEPRATHLAMVRQVIAAAGGERPSRQLHRAYRKAREAGYLWHEFGGSHLILGRSGDAFESGRCSVGAGLQVRVA